MASRFFVPPEQIHNQKFILLGSEARHAAVVLRKKVGDVIDLFDGKDLSYQGRIETITSERIEGAILAKTQGAPSSKIELILCQALIKGPKWDWLLEKACEIGVTRIVPLVTERTVVKPSKQEMRDRWKRIALAASKQCGRNDVMEISQTILFAEAIKNLPKSCMALIPWEKEKTKTIRQALPSPYALSHLSAGEGKKNDPPRPRNAGEGGGEGTVSVSIFIGPEGGWEAREIELAVRHGIIPVRLGQTLLRSETAGLVAATLVLSEFDA